MLDFTVVCFILLIWRILRSTACRDLRGIGWMRWRDTIFWKLCPLTIIRNMEKVLVKTWVVFVKTGRFPLRSQIGCCLLSRGGQRRVIRGPAISFYPIVNISSHSFKARGPLFSTFRLPFVKCAFEYYYFFLCFFRLYITWHGSSCRPSWIRFNFFCVKWKMVRLRTFVSWRPCVGDSSRTQAGFWMYI